MSETESEKSQDSTDQTNEQELLSAIEENDKVLLMTLFERLRDCCENYQSLSEELTSDNLVLREAVDKYKGKRDQILESAQQLRDDQELLEQKESAFLLKEIEREMENQEMEEEKEALELKYNTFLEEKKLFEKEKRKYNYAKKSFQRQSINVNRGLLSNFSELMPTSVSLEGDPVNDQIKILEEQVAELKEEIETLEEENHLLKKTERAYKRKISTIKETNAKTISKLEENNIKLNQKIEALKNRSRQIEIELKKTKKKKKGSTNSKKIQNTFEEIEDERQKLYEDIQIFEEEKKQWRIELMSNIHKEMSERSSTTPSRSKPKENKKYLKKGSVTRSARKGKKNELQVVFKPLDSSDTRSTSPGTPHRDSGSKALSPLARNREMAIKTSSSENSTQSEISINVKNLVQISSARVASAVSGFSTSEKKCVDEFMAFSDEGYTMYLQETIGEVPLVQYNETGRIAFGSLYSLFQELVMKTDKEYIRIFCMSYDYFLDHDSMLKILIAAFFVPSYFREDKQRNENLDEFIEFKIISILKKLVKLRIDDFVDQKSWRRILLAFANTLTSEDNTRSSYGKSILEIWEDQLESCLTKKNQKNEMKCTTEKLDDTENLISFLDIDPKELAFQITLNDQYLFHQIPFRDYYLKRWERKHSQEKAPNMHHFIEETNSASYWITTSILTAFDNEKVVPDDKIRTRIISKWIQVMTTLLELNNFNSCISVYIALNMNQVFRLKDVWSQISKNENKAVEEITQMIARNYAEYREILKSISEVPCIPVHLTILSDLTFIEEMDTVLEQHENAINWEKLTIFTKAIKLIRHCRNFVYDIKEDPSIQQFLHHKYIISEEKELNETFDELREKKTMKEAMEKEITEIKKPSESKKGKKDRKKRLKKTKTNPDNPQQDNALIESS